MGNARKKGKARKKIYPIIEEASENLDEGSELSVQTDHIPSQSSAEDDVQDEIQLQIELESPPTADFARDSEEILMNPNPSMLPDAMSENLILQDELPLTGEASGALPDSVPELASSSNPTHDEQPTNQDKGKFKGQWSQLFADNRKPISDFMLKRCISRLLMVV
ncbi:hypothetical protein Dimus_005630 [Dionaea muscipula]